MLTDSFVLSVQHAKTTAQWVFSSQKFLWSF